MSLLGIILIILILALVVPNFGIGPAVYGGPYGPYYGGGLGLIVVVLLIVLLVGRGHI